MTEARERLAAWMMEHSFSTGHGDTFEDLLKELDWQVKELRGARLAGIEEAARLVDKFTNPLVVAEKLSWLESPMTFSRVMKVIADEIRALAQALQLGEREGDHG